MAQNKTQGQGFNLVIVAQSGRLQYEALILAASLARFSPGLLPRLHVAEPQPGPLWPRDPRLPDAVRGYLQDLGAHIVPFDARQFGSAYPQGNKIECLAQMPGGEPFVFLDTDTLITGPLDDLTPDFTRPTASVKVSGTWPEPELYGPSYHDIWTSLYDRFGLEIGPTLDLTQPEDFWKRFLYFNAGWFTGACPHQFGARFLTYATEIRDDPPEELACQSLDPWLDQVALPLVIASFGGGRPGPDMAGLDGTLTCHYRALPLLYARESDQVVDILEEITTQKPLRKLLRDHEPARVLIYQNRGRKIRALFDRADLPRREQVIRNTIKREGLWLR
jgi:hypothetical protein